MVGRGGGGSLEKGQTRAICMALDATHTLRLASQTHAWPTCAARAALCYMAQMPVLPYLTKQLGADMQAFGRLQAAFSAVQFLGGLLSGERPLPPALSAPSAGLLLPLTAGLTEVHAADPNPWAPPPRAACQAPWWTVMGAGH